MNSDVMIYLGLGLFIIFVAIILRLLRREKFPYGKVDSIVTNTEKVFLKILLDVVPDDFYILTKVRLADIVKVQRNTLDTLIG
jgi:Protein of unknown function (DUF2726).